MFRKCSFIKNQQNSNTCRNRYISYIKNLEEENSKFTQALDGDKVAEVLEKKYYRKSTNRLDTTILPCGVIFHQTYESQLPEWRKLDNKTYFGYCGNLNDAHNENFLIEFIKAFDPEKHHLILALYGKKAQNVLELAKNYEGITILPNVPRSQLNFLDVHLVSLLTKYTHLMIPSKAVSAVAAGGAILLLSMKKKAPGFHQVE